MQVVDQLLNGVVVVDLAPRRDARGSLTETYHVDKLAGIGIDAEFVQENEVFSARAGTLRGVHFQVDPHAQGKLLRVNQGAAWDVVVDLRADSPTFGQSHGQRLCGDDDLLVWIPAGFGHAVCTLVPDTVISYKATARYEPSAERAIRWDDPDLAISWPVDGPPSLSERDAGAPTLHELREAGRLW